MRFSATAEAGALRLIYCPAEVISMLRWRLASTVLSGLLFCLPPVFAIGQGAQNRAPVTVTVVDENGAAVPGAQVVVDQPGEPEIRATTDYAGRAAYFLAGTGSYAIRIARPGFYQQTIHDEDPLAREIRVVLQHEQMVVEQVNVTASPPGIDTQQTSDQIDLDLPEIINIPYPTSRDIRNLLQFYPGVVADESGQVHVAGSETWQTLDTLDGFDIRSPIDGMLSMRVSADAVRSIDQESTRYPAEYGRSTGGVIAFYTGMGDNKFRFNATDFLPSPEDINGIRFDKWVPRFTFAGPVVRNKIWFFDGLETEYDDIYIRELPQNADTNHLIRGSYLIRFQANAGRANILSTGVLFNDYHSPNEGLSPLIPVESTTKRDTIGWLPYVRDQRSFHSGALLDAGLGVLRYRDGFEPHPGPAYELTPELSLGSNFERQTSKSQRIEANATLYLPPQKWLGRHDLKAGIDLDHIGFTENLTLSPVNYLRENGTLLRRSVFPAFAPFTRHNVEIGAYLQDRWSPHKGVLIEPGLRLDWDEIIRSPQPEPRLAAVFSPLRWQDRTKLSAGVGLYYEHTQLEYLARALAGIRSDTYFAADGVTPLGPPVETVFTARDSSLREARALNWSVEVEQRLPWEIFAKGSYMRKRVWDEFTYAAPSNSSALSGNFVLTNSREDHDDVTEIEGRRTFPGGSTIFAAYTHSTAHTNAAIDYVPTVSMLGPQQSGPLGWNTPNRILSWGWMPFFLPWFKKNWDLVYTVDRHTGFPFTALNANHQVVGAANSYRFPEFVSISPGLEWRFHFRGKYFGLRGVMENASDSTNPAVVNNIVDSPQFGRFSVPIGRALTARLRLIGEGK
jgi:hypothetical protein